MKYLLDTNVIIDLLKGNKKVIENLQNTMLCECCISDITVFELYYGAYRSRNPSSAITEIDKLISAITVLDTTNSMKEAARQKAALAEKGALIEDFDLIIGASAITNGLTLVTGNTKHLGRLAGLSMENWK